MRVAITGDHHGAGLVARLITALIAAGHEVDDRTPQPGDDPFDYPPLCAEVCGEVTAGRADRAVVVGGSGQGEAVACNKVRGIRAGLCSDVWGTEISRGHNDSNVLVLGAKVVSPELAEMILQTWLTTPFKGGVHQRRLEQIASLERGEPLN